MASSLGMLKSLPCPAGKSCTAFQCLFKHEDDTQAKPAGDDGTTTTDTGSSDVPLAPSTNQDAPRKRQKVAGQAGRAAVLPEKAPEPQVQAISPSLKHKKDPAMSTSAQPEKPSPGMPGIQKTKDPKPAIAAVPQKVETLNARHLGKAPAKHDMRNKLLKLLHEHYVRLNTELKKETKGQGPEAALILSDQELIVKALDEEEHYAVKKLTIYNNAIKNRIMHYKKMKLVQWKEERLASIKEEYGTGEEPKQAPKPIETGLTPEQEVDFLHRLSIDLVTLQHFGYIATVPKDEDIEKAKKAVEASGNFEVCDRCTRRFAVFPGRREEDGALASNGPCVHHPGKAYYLDRIPGDRLSERTRKYRCCHQSFGDTNGCTTTDNHVFKSTDPARLASVVNFVETPPNPNVPKDRAVSFDCEMGYTVYGMELIRITAVSWPAGEELLDVLVLPVGEYIDLNTRYSGVRPEDLAEAERWKPGDDHRPTVVPSTDGSPPQRKLKLVPSPQAARDLFFSLISPDTPVIAHGAENDLTAARIVHPTVVDTVLLYPHKRGLPIRNSLKYLMEAMLDRKIQVDDTVDKMQGHDSAEDARAAGDLVRLKVKTEWEDRKRRGWTIDANGVIQPPSESEAWSIPGKKGKAH